jgi:hypothetical protein
MDLRKIWVGLYGLDASDLGWGPVAVYKVGNFLTKEGLCSMEMVKPYLMLREGNRFRVFENRMLRRIFGPKREDMAGDRRRLYTSPNIIRAIKSRRMRWARYIARMR